MTELIELLTHFVSIDSVNPDLVAGGAGEGQIAQAIAQWLEGVGLEVTLGEAKPGRPNVIGTAGRRKNGRTLLLLAHMDTVGTAGMTQPHSPRVEGDLLYGRGAYDMKSGLVAAMSAASMLTEIPGEVVVAAVSDEEAGGAGTKALLASRRRFDAAIVTEPTDLDVAIAHKGFAGFEIETAGQAAHGSQPELGVDAILAMGPVLIELAELERSLQEAPGHPLLGPASLHASRIEGGQEASSYPARCLVTGEWRTLADDDVMGALQEVVVRSGVDADLRLTYQGQPLETPPDAEIVQVLRRHAETELTGVRYWADSALLAESGIPTVLFGPRGGGAHATVECVDLPSVERVRDVLVATARDFCGE